MPDLADHGIDLAALRQMYEAGCRGATRAEPEIARLRLLLRAHNIKVDVALTTTAVTSDLGAHGSPE